MKLLSLFATALLCFPLYAAQAQDTNNLSDAEVHGRAFVQKILQQWPAENTTNTGTLQVKSQNGKRSRLPLTCIVTVNGPVSWSIRYEVKTSSNTTDTLVVTHSLTEPNRYARYTGNDESTNLLAG